MSVPKSTVWSCANHTQAKHRLLERYLGAWFPILSKYHQKLVYIDGFAGPGVYEGGEKGSPIVALETALSLQKHLSHSEVIFQFIEQDPSRVESLRQIIAKMQLPNNFKVFIENGTFEYIVENGLNSLDSSRNANAPIFAFIDPFGFGGVPYRIIKRLLTKEKTEVFVYFDRNGVNRFLETKSVESHMLELFGEKIKVPEGVVRRSEYIKSQYDRVLRNCARFVGSFSMESYESRPIYDLFFASNNETGHIRMKEAMWAVDESGGFRYSDKVEEQLHIVFANPIGDIKRVILDNWGGKSAVAVSEIQRFTCNETVYLPKHMRSALKELEAAKRIEVHSKRLNGETRRKNAFNDDVVIDLCV